MNFAKVILSLAVFAPLSLFAQSNLVDLKLGDNSPEMIFARSQLYNPQTDNLAFRALVHEGWKSNNKTEIEIRNIDRETLKIVNGIDYRNGYVEAIGKDLVVTGGAVKEIPIPTNTVNKLIEDGLDKLGVPGKHYSLPPEKSVQVMASMLVSFQNPHHPRHAEAKKLIGEHFPKLVPGKPMIFTPEVMEQLRYDSVIYKINQGQTLTKEDSKTLQKLINERAAEQLKEMRQLSKNIADKDKDEAAAKARAQKWQDGAGAIGQFAELSRRIGNPYIGEKLQHTSRLVTFMGEADRLTGSFSKNPMAYTNVYLGMAMAAASLLSDSNGKSEMSALFEQLQAIAMQIEKLREEMHSRFDAIDRKLDYYFSRTWIDLNRIDNSVNTIKELAIRSLNESRQINNAIRTGIRFLFEQKHIEDLTRCLGKPNGIANRLDSESALKCRNEFARLTMSEWNVTDGSSTKRDLRSVLSKEYAALLKASDLIEIKSSELEDKYHPGNWLLGASYFLDFFKVHPEYRNFAIDHGIAAGDRSSLEALTLKSIIERGQNYSQQVRSLVLKENGPNQFSLRADVIKNLFDRYRNEIAQAIESARREVTNASKHGPNVDTPIEHQPPPNLDGKLEYFEQQPLQFCEYYEQTKIPRNSYVRVPPSSGIYPGDSVVRDTIRAANPTQVKFNKQLLTKTIYGKVNKNLLWMINDEDVKLRIFPCVRAIDVGGFTKTRDQKLAVPFSIAIDLMRKYDAANSKFETLERIQLTGTRLLAQKYFSITFNKVMVPMSHWATEEADPFSAPGSFWDRLADDDSNVRNISDSDPNVIKALSVHIERYLKLLSARKTIAESEARKLFATGNFSFRKLPGLALAIGIDQTNIHVREVTRALLEETAFPTADQAIDLYFKHGLSPDQINQAVDNRLKIAMAQVNQLSQETNLQPKSGAIDHLLERLAKLERSPHRSGFLNWLFH